MSKIVEIQLNRVQEQLDERHNRLNFSKDTLQWLANNDCDRVYCARSLNRLIHAEVLNLLSLLILEAKVKDNYMVDVTLFDDKLQFVPHPLRVQHKEKDMAEL
jgi:ATP-dependent Clp protease ATP-binding subunit ClpA